MRDATYFVCFDQGLHGWARIGKASDAGERFSSVQPVLSVVEIHSV